MRVVHGSMLPPFFGFRFDIVREVPASQASQARGRDANGVEMIRYAGDPVVRSCLPEPVGGRLGVIAKALLTFAKRLLRPLAVLDVGRRSVPFDNVPTLIAQRLGPKQKPPVLTI